MVITVVLTPGQSGVTHRGNTSHSSTTHSNTLLPGAWTQRCHTSVHPLLHRHPTVSFGAFILIIAKAMCSSTLTYTYVVSFLLSESLLNPDDGSISNIWSETFISQVATVFKCLHIISVVLLTQIHTMDSLVLLYTCEFISDALWLCSILDHTR